MFVLHLCQQRKGIIPHLNKTNKMSTVAVIEIVEEQQEQTNLFDQEVQNLMEGMMELGQKTGKQIISIGGYLIQKKSDAKHGEWIPYLEANGINRRTASNFMKAHKLFLEGKYDGSQNITELLRGHHKASMGSNTTEKVNKPIVVTNIDSLNDIGQGNKATLMLAINNLCLAIARAEKAKKPITLARAEKIVFKAIND
jgi:hypothetical protein